jgi:hypothetical protein
MTFKQKVTSLIPKELHWAAIQLNTATATATPTTK